MWKHLPNLLSALRITAVPFFVFFLLVFDDSTFGARVALGIYFFASITDIFDGKIARKYNLTSNLGTVLDAGADKLFVVAGFICPAILGVLPWWMVILTFIREIIVLILAYLALKKNVIPHATQLGRFRTVFQMATVVAILIFMAITNNLDWSGLWLLDNGEANFLTVLVSAIAWIGLVSSLLSLPQYFKVYIVENRKLKEEAAKQQASEENNE